MEGVVMKYHIGCIVS